MTPGEALQLAKVLEPELYALGIELEKTCAGLLSIDAVLKKHRPNLGKNQLLGFGISRVVLGVGPYAIKYQFAGKQNQHEKKYWNIVKGTVYEKYYMPVLYCDAKYLVMPKGVLLKKGSARRACGRLMHRLDIAADKVEKVNYKLWQVLSGTGFDLHESNICLHMGKTKVLDYGL